jgi:DNA-binding transcriptional MerR regulator
VPAGPTLKPELLRIGDLADRSGVPIPTIKYYIREGLLPPPPVKTGRTMAYYDAEYLERLRLVRTLREEHFLPVRVIRAVLAERGAEPLTDEDRELLARAAPGFLARIAPVAAPATREELLAEHGVGARDLATLEEMGLIGEAADGDSGERRYDADDRALLAAFDALEAAGVNRERFPVEGMGHYVELLGELSRREVRTFLHHASDLPPPELEALAARALALTEPIIALIRKKLIQRALRAELTPVRPKEDS